MSRQRSAAKPASVAVDQRATLSVLWATVPDGMRLTYISRDTVPAQYHGGLRQRRARPLGVDLSGLGEPLRKELVWCIRRSIEQGGEVESPTRECSPEGSPIPSATWARGRRSR